MDFLHGRDGIALATTFLSLISEGRQGMEKGNGRLTIREKEVLKWLGHGKTSWDIAAILRISERTVNFHVGNIMKKLDVTSRAQAVAEAANLELAGE